MNISIKDNSSVVIRNGKVSVNGEFLDCGNLGSINKIVINNSVERIDTDLNVEVHGNVSGNVTAGANVSCDDVSGNVTAGVNVSCDDISGNVIAGAIVSCDEVKGNISAS
jgi:hypothetical protein